MTCEQCPDGLHSSDGISCELCPPGYGPTLDKTGCNLCDATPLSYSTFGVCLECHGQFVVSSNRTSCGPCPLGLGPANPERTHCATCQDNTFSKSGVCEPCEIGKIGDGIGVSCQRCPADAEPSRVPLLCRCSEGFYNSSFGMVQCLPDSMPAEGGHVCQPCHDCLDCSADLSTFRRALVAPGHALGPTASRTYEGIELGPHVNKVLHRCSHGMCIGEDASAPSRDNVTFSLTVKDVNVSAIQAVSTARALFEVELSAAVARALLISTRDDIIVNSVKPAPIANFTRLRLLQGQDGDAVVSLTVPTANDIVQMLLQRIEQLRSSNNTMLKIGGRATALTSSFPHRRCLYRLRKGSSVKTGTTLPRRSVMSACPAGWRVRISAASRVRTRMALLGFGSWALLSVSSWRACSSVLGISKLQACL